MSGIYCMSFQGAGKSYGCQWGMFPRGEESVPIVIYFKPKICYQFDHERKRPNHFSVLSSPQKPIMISSCFPLSLVSRISKTPVLIERT